MFERIRKIICDQLGLEADQVTESTEFILDLGCDSLELIELMIAVENEFGITDIPEDEVAEFCELKSFTLMPMTREESAEFLDTFTPKVCYLLWDADACANDPADFGIER